MGKYILSLVAGIFKIHILKAASITTIGMMAADQIFKKYVFADFEFAGFLFIMVLLDGLLGLYYCWRSASISDKFFEIFFLKIGVYFCVLIAAHVFTNFTVNGEVNSISDYIFSYADNVLYSAIMIRELLSILKRAEQISPGLIPKYITQKLQKFNDTGNGKSDEK